MKTNSLNAAFMIALLAQCLPALAQSQAEAANGMKTSCLTMLKSFQPDVAKDKAKSDAYCQCQADVYFSKVSLSDVQAAMNDTLAKKENSPVALKVKKATADTEMECQKRHGVKPVTADDIVNSSAQKKK